MTLDEYIDKMFQQNLELAREELAVYGPDDEDYECRVWRYATTWTQENVADSVGKYLSNKWAGRQEAINKVFYG